MELWLEFGRGPMFRFCFAITVFGLLRILVLTLVGMSEAYRRSSDKVLPWGDLTKKTLSWMFPFGSIWRRRPIYSSVSILFHLALLSVPLLLAAHALLWEGALGFAWPAMPQPAADALTLLMIATALGLLAARLAHAGSRSLSRKQDYMWPVLLLVPFVTGYVCVNAEIAPQTYDRFMLFHIYSANLILLLMPFGKIAHCILMPLSQYVTGIAWKFPPGAGNRVAETLGYADRPTWVERPRLATDKTIAPTEEV